MKKIKAEIELTETQWQQLAYYIRSAREGGTYYGYKKHFDDRDEAICQEICRKVKNITGIWF